MEGIQPTPWGGQEEKDQGHQATLGQALRWRPELGMGPWQQEVEKAGVTGSREG